ncbi:Diacylglycerol kinase [bioreactor metagenome]|uniref:Diacylglycerol kinase n=1 Tax=bioreactor metagenome TaxID=1076179 RepID=A0A645F1T8_9ZZZZ
MKQWKSGNLISKTMFSLNGIYSAFVTENAVRREFGALAFFLVLAIWMGKDIKTILAVFLAGLFPIIIELINTAAETIIDLLLGPIYREDVKHAKDMLSAAVMLSLLLGYGAAFLLIFGN